MLHSAVAILRPPARTERSRTDSNASPPCSDCATLAIAVIRSTFVVRCTFGRIFRKALVL